MTKLERIQERIGFSDASGEDREWLLALCEVQHTALVAMPSSEARCQCGSEFDHLRVAALALYAETEEA